MTSWTDEEGLEYPPESIVRFNRMRVDLSAGWDLNRYAVSASIPTGHGVVRVFAHNDEPPLPDDVFETVDLSSGQSTGIYYDSFLSIQCVADEGYAPSSLKVNGVSARTDATYVFVSAETGNKTRGMRFDVEASFEQGGQEDNGCLKFTAQDAGASVTFNGDGSQA